MLATLAFPASQSCIASQRVRYAVYAATIIPWFGDGEVRLLAGRDINTGISQLLLLRSCWKPEPQDLPYGCYTAVMSDFLG